MNKLPSYTYHDLRAYTNGTMRLMIKTSKPVWIGIQTSTSIRKWLVMTNGYYGFSTNNTWCSVAISLSVYTSQGSDLSRVSQYLKLFAGSGENYLEGTVYYLDKIFWYK